MKRPSFQFYPGDWQSDLKLRRCSPAARGVWIDMLCAFHDSDDGYGLLRWPLKDIAATIGASMAHVRELVDKGVLRGSDTSVDEAFVYVPRSGRKDGDPVTLIDIQTGPLWYSKRLVKDEYIRTIRGEASRFGADDGEAPKRKQKASPKPPFGDGTSSSSSSSSSEERNTPPTSLGPPAAAVDESKPLTAKDLEAEGIAPQIASDWLKVRRAKKAPLTRTAWDGVKREAEAAGVTPSEAVRIAAESGWQGFKAAWLTKAGQKQQQPDPFEAVR